MTMNPVYEKLNRCYESIREKIPFAPEVALILGSGLGDYADGFAEEGTIDYHEIEGFPVSTVPGHKGRFIFTHVEGVPVVMMQGRVHYYEGYPMSDVVLPTRLMKLMGAKVLFLTNAAGGVNYDFSAGDFMMIKDQISCFVPSPLLGPNAEELGPRFADMSHIYDETLQQKIRDSAAEMGIQIQEGVYLQLTGPAYESPAEVRMCRILGADAVGMSTACEAVAANHMGYKICGISCISNLACGMTEQPLSHKEVQETADRVAPLFKELVTKTIKKIGQR
ncbi:MAG: purine-nucleoside phosphorylase [Lachnospiraceae bacterium]|nr:purine-nucleoside phosphorylase [Lachnospiraceae bacterium]